MMYDAVNNNLLRVVVLGHGALASNVQTKRKTKRTKVKNGGFNIGAFRLADCK